MSVCELAPWSEGDSSSLGISAIFLEVVTKHMRRSSLREKGLVLAPSWKLQSVVVVEFEAAGHIPSTVKKQREVTAQC